MKVIAIGRTDILYHSIGRIIDDGHEIVAIITSKPTQYQYTKTQSHFEALSKEIGSELILTETLSSSNIFELIKK